MIYLYEDIDAVKKYYPKIDDSVFMALIQLDPTYRDGSNSLGKYGKWILNLYNKGAISKEDFSEITPLLQQFTTYKNRVQNKDLNAYKTLDDLSDTLAQVVDDDSMLSDRQKLRFKKNVKAGKTKVDAEDDYDVVLETPKFIVYVPNTHEASMFLGKGTDWCTAHENSDWYEEYTEDGHKLYIVKNKKTGERWQYSDLKDDFLDQDDEEFDIPSLMRQDEKLSEYFKQFLDVDYYNFDGTWIYEGQLIPTDLVDNVENIIIADGITSIRSGAFSHWSNLTSVTIPDSVTSIGDYAFAYCPKLTVYTDNDYVIDYCNDNDIKVRPSKEFVKESFKKQLKLHIEEDTACVASKTSYMDEDGLDKNGIYYFGDKPKLPVSWKDYKKDDNKKHGLKEGNTMKLRINESIADENGMFMQMDDAMEGLIGNVSDSDIDEVVRYYSTVSGKLGKKDKYSSIYCYFSNESWLDPLENRSDFDLTPMYKNGKYDAHICNSKYGKFIVDHFSNNFDFTMYATDESIIDNVLKDIELKYE